MLGDLRPSRVPDLAVDQLPDDVGVAGVAAGLGRHVDKKHIWFRPPRHRTRVSSSAFRLIGGGACVPVAGDDVLSRFISSGEEVGVGRRTRGSAPPSAGRRPGRSTQARRMSSA